MHQHCLLKVLLEHMACHVGTFAAPACCGAVLPPSRVPPSSKLHMPPQSFVLHPATQDHRDFVSQGASAGFCMAFITPIAGTLFPAEEGGLAFAPSRLFMALLSRCWRCLHAGLHAKGSALRCSSLSPSCCEAAVCRAMSRSPRTRFSVTGSSSNPSFAATAFTPDDCTLVAAAAWRWWRS